jgi:hypothetical protein
MAKAIRKIGLKIAVALARLISRPAPRGWVRSRRAITLRGR